MFHHLRGFAFALLGFLVLTNEASAQGKPPRRITERIDESRLTTLRGNRHALARAEFDRGAAPGTLAMDRMLLVLGRSPEQKADLRRLLDEQQDKASPNFQKWMTPDEFGERFGPSDEDVREVTEWLQSHSFQVAGVSRGRGTVEFSGTARQVERAFHTQMRRYVVNGEDHWANDRDPQIPAALTTVVVGVASLHNFQVKPQSVSRGTVTARRLPGQGPGLQPEITFSASSHALSPADYRVLYNINPIAATGINGSGSTIAIVGRTNINASDIANFRSVFGLPVNPPEIIFNGAAPGNLGGGEETEAILDISWAGATAPNATIKFVSSKTTAASDGVILSEIYIVDHNLADIMSESFGDCEDHYPVATAVALNSIREQAAAQGITFLVSSGDTGVAGCDAQGQTSANGPLSVNILASSPYNIAVGGTQFNEHGVPSQYWAASNPGNYGTALSPIPENVWNNGGASIIAGGGGASVFFAKPPWQSGVPGIPNDGVRDIPDVSLTASGSRDPYAICIRGSCIPNGQGQFTFGLVGGTSASAPAMAGILALVRQSVNHRLGQANYVLYRLAAVQNYAACDGSSITTTPASNCVFNDITSGTISVPGATGYGTPGAPYPATAGFDLASGLGSVNVTNLVQQWNSVSFTGTHTTLQVNPTDLVAGANTNLTFTVAPNSGGGTPTGDVALLTSTGVGMGYGTLTGGSLNATINNLPAGSYNLTARYAGDRNFAASDSTPIAVLVRQPVVSLSPTSLAFGSVMTGFSSAQPQSVTLTNTGNGPLAIAGVQLTGTHSGEFSQNTTCGATLAAGANCSISVTFSPTTTGAKSASLSVVSNAPGTPHTAALTGTGTTAPALSTLSVPSTSVVGPIVASGTVSLTLAAPAGGTVVSLSSSDPSAAAVPTSVTVAAGATVSPAFTITTSLVQAATTVTITATYNGVSKTDTLVVNAHAVTTLTLSPASVAGGLSATSNRVTLNAAAPAGGAVVTLSSDNPAAIVPASITVAAGQTQSPIFTITTDAVTSTALATITATYNSINKTGALTVTPAVISSVYVPSTAVVGRAPVNGNTVSLVGKAPAGGAVVSLTSSDPAAASVPASVTVAAGQSTSPTFSISTSVIPAATTVTITATYNGTSKTDTLTVNPLVISSVVMTSATVVGGTQVTSNRVNLNATPPAGGTLVQLSSSNPAVASVPATVTVAEGNTIGYFTITTTTVLAPVDVTFTATYNGSTGTAVMTVTPAALSALNVASASVFGSATATGNTVTLNGKAPAGGAVVTLSSDNAAAVVPASVAVAANATVSPTFSITTSLVSAATTATITATYNGVSKTDTLVLNPIIPTSLTISPATVGGGGSVTSNVVTLTGAAPGGGAVVSLSSSHPTVAAVPASVTVAAGSTNSPNFTITTAPVASPVTVTITATYNGVSKQATLAVTAAALSSMNVASTSVIGPANASNNTVVLSGHAEAGGAVVSLTSSHPAVAAVPATVTIAEGQSVSPAFVITTSVVTAATNVTITATYNGSSKTDTLVVNPLALSSMGLSAGSVGGGVVSNSNRATINTAAPAGGVVVALSSSNPAVAAVPASVTVAAGQTIGYFSITTTSVSAPAAVTITGTFNGQSKQITLNVLPPALSSLYVSATSVIGPNTAGSNTVSLAGKAPAGGIAVGLTSSNPAVAAVPPSVTVAADQSTSPAFGITTTVVPVATAVTITASYNGVTKTDTLVVNPLAVSSISLGSATVAGGASLSGSRVYLNAYAPTGGVTVSLSSNNPAVAAVPASVTVPQGANLSGTFTITTSAVTSPVAVTITASFNGAIKQNTVTVNPASLSTLSVAATSVIGPVTANGNTVTLAGQAPAAGITVGLSSSNPGVAAVPASVTIAAGQNVSPAFPVATSVVPVATTVTITATYNGVSKTDTLVVNPLGLTSLTLSPTTVRGGLSTTGNRVTLTAVAPVAGAAVALSSDNPAVAAVPASVTVAAGQTASPNFTITTSAVGAPVTVTITATCNGSTQQRVLTVNP